VKRYRAADGSVRVWFDPAEIDSLAEDVLQRAGLMPTLQAPVVDVEVLVEGYLEADLDQYAPLPREVLGVTEFRSGLPPQVLINRDLTEAAFDAPTPAPGARGRWRATVAHEAAHILLHRVLAEPDFSQTSLLELAPSGVSLPAQRLFRCLRREVAFGGGSDWREVQANRCMAALLMPRSVFLQAVARAKAEVGLFPEEALRSEGLDGVVRRLARRFEVSRQAARIRLEELGLVTAPGQRTLYTERPW
jgi:hypothetical protein